MSTPDQHSKIRDVFFAVYPDSQDRVKVNALARELATWDDHPGDSKDYESKYWDLVFYYCTEGKDNVDEDVKNLLSGDIPE